MRFSPAALPRYFRFDASRNWRRRAALDPETRPEAVRIMGLEEGVWLDIAGRRPGSGAGVLFDPSRFGLLCLEGLVLAAERDGLEQWQ